VCACGRRDDHINSAGVRGCTGWNTQLLLLTHAVEAMTIVLCASHVQPHLQHYTVRCQYMGNTWSAANPHLTQCCAPKHDMEHLAGAIKIIITLILWLKCYMYTSLTSGTSMAYMMYMTYRQQTYGANATHIACPHPLHSSLNRLKRAKADNICTQTTLTPTDL